MINSVVRHQMNTVGMISVMMNSTVRYKMNSVIQRLVYAVDPRRMEGVDWFSFIDLWIVHESAGSFFEDPENFVLIGS